MAEELFYVAAVCPKTFLPDNLALVQATMWVVVVIGQMPPLAVVEMTILCAGVGVAAPWVALVAAVEAKKQRQCQKALALFQLAYRRLQKVSTTVDLLLRMASCRSRVPSWLTRLGTLYS